LKPTNQAVFGLYGHGEGGTQENVPNWEVTVTGRRRNYGHHDQRFGQADHLSMEGSEGPAEKLGLL
jgi:hypothetical protein